MFGRNTDYVSGWTSQGQSLAGLSLKSSLSKKRFENGILKENNAMEPSYKTELRPIVRLSLKPSVPLGVRAQSPFELLFLSPFRFS